MQGPIVYFNPAGLRKLLYSDWYKSTTGQGQYSMTMIISANDLHVIQRNNRGIAAAILISNGYDGHHRHGKSRVINLFILLIIDTIPCRMRALLLILVAFVGLTATTCGLLMIAYPLGTVLGLTIDLLRPTFLKDFLIPGIILTIVGSINMGAVFAIFQRSKNQYNWSLAAGMLVCTWVVAEVLLLQVVHWLQAVYLFNGILIVLLAYQFKGKWAA